MPNYVWSVTYIDGEGHKANTGGQLVAVDYATARANVITLLGEMSGITNGKMVNATVGEDLPLPAANPSAPAPSSEVELKAIFTFLCANNKRTRVSIPTLDRLNVLDNSDVIDPAVADPFRIAFVNGGFADSNYSDATALVSAKEGYGRKR